MRKESLECQIYRYAAWNVNHLIKDDDDDGDDDDGDDDGGDDDDNTLNNYNRGIC
jgi:hypothetical protein